MRSARFGIDLDHVKEVAQAVEKRRRLSRTAHRAGAGAGKHGFAAGRGAGHVRRRAPRDSLHRAVGARRIDADGSSGAMRWARRPSCALEIREIGKRNGGVCTVGSVDHQAGDRDGGRRSVRHDARPAPPERRGAGDHAAGSAKTPASASPKRKRSAWSGASSGKFTRSRSTRS